MGVEEIGISATSTTTILSPVILRMHKGHQFAENMVGTPSITKPSKKIDPPACTPTCRTITLDLERSGTSLGKFRSVIDSNMMSGIKPEEVRLVTMVRILVLPVEIPFLEVTFGTNLIRQEFCQGGIHLLEEGGIAFHKGHWQHA